MLTPTRDQRRADIASARLWLAEGAPAADVLTMLEVRHRFELSSADSRAYVVEILSAAQQPTRTPKPHPKYNREETHHAVA